MKQYLGIDIGGTFIKYALVNENFEVIKKWKKVSIKFANKDDFYDYLCKDILEFDYIELVGVSAPGIIDQTSTVLSYAAINVLIMFGTNVNEEISKRTNKFVATMNDAKAAGYCEFKLGNGRNTQSSVYYVIGTGIGGCVCNAQGVIDGQDHLVGEFSYLPVGYEENGNFMMHTMKASMDSLIKHYNTLVTTEKTIKYGEEIVARYVAQELVASQAISTWLDDICMGLIMLTILYNPEIICIGGGISEEDWFIEALANRYRERCIKHFRGDIITTKIDRCLYNNDANIIGATVFAVQEYRK